MVLSDPGEIHLLSRALLGEDAPPSLWHVRLFTNNYTPNRDTTLGDLVEAAWPGYLPVEVDPETWGAPENPSGAAISYYGTNFLQWFSSSGGPFANYGFFVTFDDGAELLWSARFDAVQNVTTIAPCLVWPVITARSQFEPAPPPPPPPP